ncbi:universal stress protein [Cystobacter fuscus]|uniref:Universal stress protein n=1 Tax=Cystobacter fuscus TaxID=43 RepID=A0A250ISS8_9BACT|nr:universal stress protein [Cystobacter fuscus]ATB34804.1 universal stress protein [Cystobacter fuscus]
MRPFRRCPRYWSEATNRVILCAFSRLPDGGTVYEAYVGGRARDEAGARDPLSGCTNSCARTRTPRGARCRWRFLRGKDVATTLLQTAQRLDADVLCVGTHRRGGLKKTQMASVALAVMTRADRPVVRPPEP